MGQHSQNSLKSSNIADVVVIGAGVHGACTAMHLAARGKSVVMLDKDIGGRTASMANAGGVRRLMRHTTELPLAMVAADMWDNMAAIVGDDCDFHKVGQLSVAENQEELKTLEARADVTRGLGYDFEEIISVAELRKAAPALSDRFVGGLIARDDGHACPFKTTRAFQKTAVKNGVVFRQGQPVVNTCRKVDHWVIETPEERYATEIVVNCAGAWGAPIAAMLGDAIPSSVRAPSMMVTARTPRFLEPVIVSIARKFSFKQMPNGTVLIGGGNPGRVNADTDVGEVDFAKLQQSAKTVVDFFPHMNSVPIIRCWAGVEGDAPDKIPIIGAGAKHPGVYHAFSFTGHGFQLAPIVGKLLSELILTGRSSISLDAFSPERFQSILQK